MVKFFLLISAVFLQISFGFLRFFFLVFFFCPHSAKVSLLHCLCVCLHGPRKQKYFTAGQGEGECESERPSRTSEPHSKCTHTYVYEERKRDTFANGVFFMAAAEN